MGCEFQMAVEIEAYLQARKNFEKIAGEIDDLAFRIVEVGTFLRDNPWDIAFDNTGLTVPAAVSRTIDAMTGNPVEKSKRC